MKMYPQRKIHMNLDSWELHIDGNRYSFYHNYENFILTDSDYKEFNEKTIVTLSTIDFEAMYWSFGSGIGYQPNNNIFNTKCHEN